LLRGRKVFLPSAQRRPLSRLRKQHFADSRFRFVNASFL
jgi:hypothetical protein